MTCKHWKKYPKTSGKPICAFTSRGKFKSNNWNCYHINRLRELCRSTSIFFTTTGIHEEVTPTLASAGLMVLISMPVFFAYDRFVR